MPKSSVEVGCNGVSVRGKSLSTIDTVASTLGKDNPIRYRGYYYDIETGLYYLQSRYYDPATGRFISMDDVVVLTIDSGSLVQHNLFAYCLNNPVINSDPSGYVVSPANIIGGIIGAIIGAVGGYFLSRWLADKLNLKGWKRTVFIAGLTAVITAAAAVIGYFIGPYVQKAGRRIIRALARVGCFPAGTLVETEHGNIPIEDISTGDNVYSIDPITGESGFKQVTATSIQFVNYIVRIELDENVIETTPYHPFWVDGKGWVLAENLTSSDALCTVNGDRIIIKSVSNIWLKERVAVYNFEVQDWHTYFVSGYGVIVHNGACMPTSPTRLTNSYAIQFAKKYGYASVEELKAEFVTGAVSHWDLDKDTATGIIWLMNKQQNIFLNTGLKFK